MKEVGTVVAVFPHEIEVEFLRTEACKKCGGCKQGQDGSMRMVMRNDVGAAVGDKVAVELAESRLIGAGLMAYGLPLVALFVGLLAGAAIAPLFTGIDENIFPVAGALLGVLLAFLANRIIEPRRRKKSTYMPRAVLVEKRDGSG